MSWAESFLTLEELIMNQPVPSIASQIFLKEFEIGPYKAPALMWGLAAAGILGTVGVLIWIHFNSVQDYEA